MAASLFFVRQPGAQKHDSEYIRANRKKLEWRLGCGSLRASTSMCFLEISEPHHEVQRKGPPLYTFSRAATARDRNLLHRESAAT